MALRLATRGSPLARWQAEHVAGLLRLHGEVEGTLVIVDTLGDRSQDHPIWALGGQGVFVREVEAAVLDGRADVAVHSAKDLPANPALVAGDLDLVAVPERGDPRDALVGTALGAIPPGGVVATGSVRRRAQLAGLRPDLTFAGLRGNIETRLGRARHGVTVVVAAAALERLGRAGEATEVLDPEVVVPQVSQGALALQCRREDSATVEALAPLDHGPSRRAVEAERSFLAALGEGCELPVGAHAVESDGRLALRGLLSTLDGRVVLCHQDTGPSRDPVALGRRVADHLLRRSGGEALVSEWGMAGSGTGAGRGG